MNERHPYRDSFSYWVWFAAFANLVIVECECGGKQLSANWYRRFFTG